MSDPAAHHRELDHGRAVMSQLGDGDNVFDQDNVWEYLKIAFDLETAANAALTALQSGQSVVEAERAGVESYSANHIPVSGPDAPQVPTKGHTLPAGETIMALALTKLVSKKRRRFEVRFRWLRYPMNTETDDDLEKLRQKIERRLSNWTS